MEFLELSLNLLEKISVLFAAALVLLLLRPAEVWLGETGSRASLRRRAFLVAVLGGLAIWGVFLGFEIGGMRFNVRTVGIVVAGYLGGRWVGLLVGAAAGAVYGLDLGGTMAFYVFAASLLDGWLAGLWSRKIGTGVVSVVAGAVVIQAIHHVGLGGVMAVVDFEQAFRLASNLELNVAKVAANTVGVTVFMGLLSLIRELEMARRQARTSRDMVRSARLEALQYQVRPHFLFNLLNTLAYLIRTNPGRARELTLDLAEFLRYTLARPDEQTTLAEELDQIERYVDLERARFGDGLSFDITTEGPENALYEVLVPPLILQPLVENALRHGARDGKVRVCIEVVADQETLDIRVLDDGPGPSGLPEHGERIGVGLENVRERLQRFYRGRAQLQLRPRVDAQGACAHIQVPLEAATEETPTGLREQAREKLKQVIS